MPHPFTSTPRTLMALSSVFYGVGAYVADWNTTHVMNPNWPGHARFHNGQTMSLGLLQMLLVVWLLSRYTGSYASKLATKHTRKEYVFIAALVNSLYCAAGLSAIWYPGTLWVDDEFRTPGDVHAPQLRVFGGQLVVNWLAYAAEIRRLEKEDGGSKSK